MMIHSMALATPNVLSYIRIKHYFISVTRRAGMAYQNTCRIVPIDIHILYARHFSSHSIAGRNINYSFDTLDLSLVRTLTFTTV
jgi:hypothetical protein